MRRVAVRAAMPQVRAVVRRRLLGWALGIGFVLVILLIAAAGFLALADRFDFASLAAKHLTASLERRVRIGSLRVTPGRWLHVELKDFQLDNLPNGSRPVMAKVKSASAEIEALSLLHGPVMVRGLTVTDLDLLLEHTSDGRKNWKWEAAAQTASPRRSNRTSFPTLLNALVTGEVVFRTASGHNLDTHLEQLRLRTQGPDKPVRLDGSGSYNGAPMKVEADLASLDALREADAAYAADIHVASGATKLHFQGAISEPLKLDGAKGGLELLAPNSDAILQVAGASGAFDASLRLIGWLEHDGPLWHLSQASGTLNEDTITAADVKLVEGSSGRPDDVAVDIAFDELNTNALFAAGKKGSGSEADVPLTIGLAPDPLVAAKVSAHKLAYNGVKASDATLSGSLQPGRVTVDLLSLGYLGAPFRANGQIEAVPGVNDKAAGRVTASVDMQRMDVQALRKLLDAGNLPLLGGMDGRVLVEATGATLNQAAREARLSAVFAMNDGSISRQIIELASTDARTIFRHAAGMSPISCLVAVVDIRNGRGTVSPLRIQSADGTITGRGSFDIYRHQIDVTIASEARTTSVFALDVPVRVSGSFASPTIRPATLSPTGRAQLSAGDDVTRLLPGLQPFARRSPCLSSRAG